MFQQLFGFPEGSHAEVQSRLRVEEDPLSSSVNGASYACGRLEMTSLSELRERVSTLKLTPNPSTCREIVADAKALHADPENAGVLFQVASQFNLLEMCGPGETPEMGISKYAGDPTQGSACALACFAGTVYRNYFVHLGDQIGQTADRQVDCLADLRDALGNRDKRLWEMRITWQQLQEIFSSKGPIVSQIFCVHFQSWTISSATYWWSKTMPQKAV